MWNDNYTHLATTITEKELSPPERKDLPVFKKEDVKKHGKGSETIWVTYKTGVYDITEFHKLHPGGDKILLAAGGAVDPYWSLYAQHKTAEVMEILEEYRIGNLDPKDVEATKTVDASNPFSKDPERHPALVVNQQQPFNAETPAELNCGSFSHSKRVDPKKHRLTIDGKGVKRPMKLSVDELKKNYRPVSITSAIQCTGNRRSDMSKKRKDSLGRGPLLAMPNGQVFALRDLLILAGVDPNDRSIKHVQLEGADSDSTGQSYGASIPFEKAMSPEVIIAYSMNGEDIPRDHGAPLRCIIP
ncbi:cytochrome b5-like Heme/Steroid binding domain protein, partial [Ostertagia ostertagi]